MNIIALCESGSDAECISAMKAGARACISRDIPSKSITATIKLVADGDVVISSAMADAMLQEFKLMERVKGTAGLKTSGILSDRENAVLNLVAEGLTNKEIADQLFLSRQTVMVHMRNIMRKLHAHTREQAVAFMRAQNQLSEVDSTSVR
jgi:DNA-binding NarL/FixJ family response regulator